jgi:hypothetical protein
MAILKASDSALARSVISASAKATSKRSSPHYTHTERQRMRETKGKTIEQQLEEYLAERQAVQRLLDHGGDAA